MQPQKCQKFNTPQTTFSTKKHILFIKSSQTLYTHSTLKTLHFDYLTFLISTWSLRVFSIPNSNHFQISPYFFPLHFLSILSLQSPTFPPTPQNPSVAPLQVSIGVINTLFNLLRLSRLHKFPKAKNRPRRSVSKPKVKLKLTRGSHLFPLKMFKNQIPSKYPIST